MDEEELEWVAIGTKYGTMLSFVLKPLGLKKKNAQMQNDALMHRD